MAAKSAGIVVDTRDVLPTLKALQQVEKALRDEANTRLRQAAATSGAGLAADLKASAARSATPQAALVAKAIRVRRDRLISVEVGGPLKVGRYGAPAGALLWGSEHGGTNFKASAGGEYWIAPAVDAFKGGKAERAYITAVNAILRDAGL